MNRSFQLSFPRLTLVWSLAALAWLEAVSLAAGAPFSLAAAAARAVFSAAVLAGAWVTQPQPAAGRGLWAWPWTFFVAGGLSLLAGWIAVGTQLELAAWLLLALLFAILISLNTSLASRAGFLKRAFLAAWLALAAGAGAAVLGQVEARFSEEEFFTALQGLALAVYWLLLLAAWRPLQRASAPVTGAPQTGRRRPHGPCLKPAWMGLVAGLFMLAGGWQAVNLYRHSFYPPAAPAFRGITDRAPFLCGSAPADTQSYPGEAVFERLVKLVAANPKPRAPEYGMLALGSGDMSSAELFRTSLLEEARAGLYTQPANSVKSVQFEAAMRVYYYSQVQERFPGLFSPAETEQLNDWFAAINRRVQTVEWVDWMYALAFSKKPEGPYENQENGAGLLALLETHSLADPEMSARNRAYLQRNPRGWLQRFRNTDDAFIYQSDWLFNAFYQSGYTGQVDSDLQRLSFEWLLLQALPDGAPLRYNHPAFASLAGSAYLGAVLLDDPRFVWLSGRGLDYLEAQGKTLSAKPGVEAPLSLTGTAPTQGSCLLYGGSGLPNQAGTLAPDKLVLRGGWSPDSTYLLLNLRFSGWHRYKASNTITLFYQSGALIEEDLSGQPFPWLPSGRSLFRDKRIPRQNLNGLQVERTGLSAALYILTGAGGQWAQDPPYYARVERFETGAEMDFSRTALEGWRGWDHQRSIYFYHSGPVVVVDQAVRSGASGGGKAAGRQAAFTWHIPAGSERLQGNSQIPRWRLKSEGQLAEMALVPLETEPLSVTLDPASSDLQRVWISSSSGQLGLATVFLTREWAGAQVSLVPNPQLGRVLQIAQGDQVLELPLSSDAP